MGKQNTGRATEAAKIQVWAASAGRCAICKQYLAESSDTGQQVLVGEVAHIAGTSEGRGSPRGSSDVPVEDRGKSENLVLLCRDSHKTIDTPEFWDMYPEEELRKIKRTHEHQMKQLSGLSPDNKSTVLRITGGVRGATKSISRSSVSWALLRSGKFPVFALERGHDYEIDLRHIPGEMEGNDEYLRSAIHHVRSGIDELNSLIKRDEVASVSVFAFARIPILIAAGAMLDDKVPADFYPASRTGELAWGWGDNTNIEEFSISELGGSESSVLVVLSISGTVDFAKIPSEISGATTYCISPAEGAPHPEIIGNSETLDNFSKTWRTFLALIERDHPEVDSIAVIGALPLTAALSVGRHRMLDVQPPLRVYDLPVDGDGYMFQIEVA